MKIRIKLGISVLHKTLALPINRSNSAGFLAIFSTSFLRRFPLIHFLSKITIEVSWDTSRRSGTDVRENWDWQGDMEHQRCYSLHCPSNLYLRACLCLKETESY